MNIICDAQGQGGPQRGGILLPESKSPALIKDQHEAEDESKECNFQYRAALLFHSRSQHRIRLKTVTFH
ncbi:hypothetical protein PSHT_12084 [Puccinia striiformis]|uniref:Uncharacterized protein n=1 Tax=Puccinia striiformis TaxID=27350 RepID=A0A2S4UZ65_9BASI|nr:hypothetical protein PSHT_12084 [Puccinia striiformis]